MEFAEYFPIWDKLTAQQQERIAGVIEYRTVKKGTRIHDSSSECLGLVLVHSGQLRTYILSEDGREITFHDSRGIKMCTFVGYFDGKNAFRLRFYSREYGGVVPKTRVIYLADLEKTK